MKTYCFKELQVGLNATFEVDISLEMMNQFKKLSGDKNPLHLDRAFARQKGFENQLVYGMLTASFYSTLIGVHLPGMNALLQGVDVQFSKPVYPGDHLTIYGEIVYINKAYKQVEVKATIKNQSNEKVSKAKIRVGVLDE